MMPNVQGPESANYNLGNNRRASVWQRNVLAGATPPNLSYLWACTGCRGPVVGQQKCSYMQK